MFGRTVMFRYRISDYRFAPVELRRTRELLGRPAGHRRGVRQRAGDHSQAGRVAAGRRNEKPLRQRHTDA